MPGGFASGLSIGLSDELGAQRVAKEKRNQEEKSQVLKLLGSLADQVEPESKSLLYRHIGDVIGLKGKNKGIFARLTGADLDSDQGAMQSKLQEILGTLQGPQAREAAIPKPEVRSAQQVSPLPGVNLGMPTEPGYQAGVGPDQAQQMRQGQMYLRDPRREELQELRAKYGLMRDQKLSEIEERDRLSYQTRSKLQEDQQAFAASQASQREEDRIRRPVEQRAFTKAYAQGRSNPTTQEYMQAAAELEKEQGLKAGVLQERINLMISQGKLADYQTSIDPTTGEMRGKAPTEMQRRQFDQSQLQNANVIVSDFGKAKAQATALGNQAQQLFERIKGIVEADPNLVYDASRNLILDKATGAPSAMKMKSPRIKAMLDEFSKLMKAKEEAVGIMRGKKQIIKDSYGTMFNTGANDWDDIQMLPGVGGGVAPAGAPRTGSPNPTMIDATTPKARNLIDVGKVGRFKSSNQYKVGEIVEDGVQQVKILKIIKQDGMDTTYEFRRLK